MIMRLLLLFYKLRFKIKKKVITEKKEEENDLIVLLLLLFSILVAKMMIIKATVLILFLITMRRHFDPSRERCSKVQSQRSVLCVALPKYPKYDQLDWISSRNNLYICVR